MHVEFYNPTQTHCFYMVNKNGESSVSYWHPMIKDELTSYDVGMSVHDLLEQLRPSLKKLMTELDSSERWRIRIFKFDDNKFSLTRGTMVVEEFVTGDVIIVDGVMRETLLHPSWSIKK